jgi:hypothetical protein
VDNSLYKLFSLCERVKLRVNVDAFNAFKIQGRNPNTTESSPGFLLDAAPNPVLWRRYLINGIEQLQPYRIDLRLGTRDPSPKG